MRESLFLCDTSGKRLPCLHKQTFAGQRTANDLGRELDKMELKQWGKVY